MKKLLLLPILLCCTLFCSAQFREQLNTKASISFPVAAQKGKSDQNNYWVADTGKDSLAMHLMAMTLNSLDYDLSAKAIADNYDKPEFIDALIGGMVGEKAHIKELNRNKIFAGKAKGYAIDMINETPDEEYPYTHMYIRFLFSGTTIYMLGAYTDEEEANAKIRDQFFNSLTIKP
ncbi:hypothetical protein [Taibaiella chishuiensis]|uniref:PsbP protein n=1 Tax=Taibaiella chishuiensis TaxID=1434707 RepID=A0A2P8D9N2_9BACT|nr:hypothetical protein [Taibaiella chishuiensis]PSK93930.1 hypothetical protein B0I18_10179 [Taibaiella chishuiensis]